jgi:hypothetical protein
MKHLLPALVGAALAAPTLAKEQPIQLDIAAGKVGEVCMALRAGDSLAWVFDASAPLDFNLHHHVGKKVLMPVERKAVASDRAEHRADRRNDWCLMWTAPAAQAVTVRGHWRITRAR